MRVGKKSWAESERRRPATCKQRIPARGMKSFAGGGRAVAISVAQASEQTTVDHIIGRGSGCASQARRAIANSVSAQSASRAGLSTSIASLV